MTAATLEPAAPSGTAIPGTLIAQPFGWSYERDGRRYTLSQHPSPCWSHLFDLELRLGRQQHWRVLDPRDAYCRASFAQEASPHDDTLRREIRRDLNFCRWLIQLRRIDLELRMEE